MSEGAHSHVSERNLWRRRQSLVRIVTLARKPCEGTVAVNVLTHGAGAVNVDACRIPVPNRDVESHPEGRWPTNLILQEGAATEDLDAQSGTLTSGSGAVKRQSACDQKGNRSAAYGQESRKAGEEQIWYGDSGGASRYFRSVK